MTSLKKEFCKHPVNNRIHLCTGEADGDAIQMAFSKKAVDDRKTWLSNFVPGTFLNSEATAISYSDFVHKVRKWQQLQKLVALCHPGSAPGSSCMATMQLSACKAAA